MAILYGTTADGESLPVEVNELGQLVAEGLPGPPGPPGVGALPPDPYEGAILGWKNNTLAWLGGSAPLPEGTFGPILSYLNGVLELESTVNLPYGARVYLSDTVGSQSFYVPETSNIVNVVDVDNTLDLAGYDSGQKGDGKDSPSTIEMVRQAFDGNPDTYYGFGTTSPDNKEKKKAWQFYNIGSIKVPSNTPVQVYGQWNKMAGIRFLSAEYPPYSISPSDGALTFPEERSFNGLFAEAGTSGGQYGHISRVTIGDKVLIWNEEYSRLTLEDDKDLSEFAVGDEVQPGVSVLAVSPEELTLTTTPNSWTVGQVVTGPLKSGEGTVSVTQGQSIVLREDNKQWKVGQYVTAPDQTIAARYIYADKRRQSVKIAPEDQ